MQRHPMSMVQPKQSEAELLNQINQLKSELSFQVNANGKLSKELKGQLSQTELSKELEEMHKKERKLFDKQVHNEREIDQLRDENRALNNHNIRIIQQYKHQTINESCQLSLDLNMINIRLIKCYTRFEILKLHKKVQLNVNFSSFQNS